MELFLHEDGTLSEGEEAGERRHPGQIGLSWFDVENPRTWRKVILNSPADTPLVAWSDTFEHFLSQGINSFQLKLGEETLDFHFPAMDGNAHLTSNRASVEVIDLRRDPGANYQQNDHNPDVLLLADESTTVDRFLRAALPHRKTGVSLMVRGAHAPGANKVEIPMMIRRRDEAFLNQEPSYSLASRIRMAFRFD